MDLHESSYALSPPRKTSYNHKLQTSRPHAGTLAGAHLCGFKDLKRKPLGPRFSPDFSNILPQVACYHISVAGGDFEIYGTVFKILIGLTLIMFTKLNDLPAAWPKSFTCLTDEERDAVVLICG